MSTCANCHLSYRDHCGTGQSHAFQGYASLPEITAVTRERAREATPRTRRPGRGNYYANAHATREDGLRFGVEVARQAPSLNAARRALEASGLRGYVQRWDDRTQQRSIVCERDEAGNWWTPDPFTGSLVALAPLRPQED